MSAKPASPGPIPSNKLFSGVRHLLIMIIAQFLLGMAINLIGLPSETTAFARIATSVILGIHILVALDLIAMAILTIRRTMGTADATLSWYGAGGILLAIVGGALVFSPGAGWWSYVMTIGAVGSLLAYGLLYIRGVRSARAS